MKPKLPGCFTQWVIFVCGANLLWLWYLLSERKPWGLVIVDVLLIAIPSIMGIFVAAMWRGD